MNPLLYSVLISLVNSGALLFSWNEMKIVPFHYNVCLCVFCSIYAPITNIPDPNSWIDALICYFRRNSIKKCYSCQKCTLFWQIPTILLIFAQITVLLLIYWWIYILQLSKGGLEAENAQKSLSTLPFTLYWYIHVHLMG